MAKKKKSKKKKKKGLKTKKARMKEVKKFKEKVLDKYGEIVKTIVVMGSVAREEFKPESDIDVFVVIDDTKEKLSKQKHDEINATLERMAKDISKSGVLSIQPTYTLTEFWNYARVGHPIIYNFIKEGVPVYDVGFFMPIKRLLNMGKIPSTREAIESYMEGAPKKLMRAKTVKLLMLAEDCYYAMLNTTQAVLMFMGVEPPVPSKAHKAVQKYLIEPKILDEKYADWLKDIIELRKKIEHKEIMDVEGSYVDEWLGRAEKYVEKMFNLLGALELRKKEKVLQRTHDVMYKAAITALKSLKKEPEKESEIPIQFRKEFIKTDLIEGYYWDIWERIEKMKETVDEDKKNIKDIPEKDVYQMREYVRKMIRDLAKALKKNGIENTVDTLPDNKKKKED